MTMGEFVSTFPVVPSFTEMFMLQAMTYKATIRLPVNIHPADVIVQAWTSQCDQMDAQGDWHAQDLELCESNEDIHTYGKSVIITSAKDYRFTFRLRVPGSQDWVWANGWRQDGTAHVEPPRMGDRWTQGVDYSHVQGALHLGNFIAAVHAAAPECSFSHVLNVADTLDMVYPLDSAVHYLKVGMTDGAHNPIQDHQLQEAVDWLIKHDKSENKLLVNCRAGIGRAGSVALGFVFATNPTWTYEQAYDFVYKKRFVYPHAYLKEKLYHLYPRQS